MITLFRRENKGLFQSHPEEVYNIIQGKTRNEVTASWRIHCLKGDFGRPKCKSMISIYFLRLTQYHLLCTLISYNKHV